MPDKPFSKHTIDVSISRYYTTVDGAILDKNDAAIPSNLKTKFPFFMFGAFDMDGGYKIGLQNTPAALAAKYLMTFVNGAGASSYSVMGFSGLNTIQVELSTGDIVHVYTDDLTNPNIFIWIVQHNAVIPLASIMGNTRTTQHDNVLGKLIVKKINFTTPLAANKTSPQWLEGLNVIKIDNVGDVRTNQLAPNSWWTPQTGLNGVLTLQVIFEVNQYTELASYMLFSTDAMQFNFIVEGYQN